MRLISAAIASLCLAICASAASDRVLSLLQSMSLEAKVGQMSQLTINALLNADPGNSQLPSLNNTKLYEAMCLYRVGSVFDSPFSGGDIAGQSTWTLEQWREITTKINDAAMNCKSNDLSPNIPVLYGLDSVHGANYVNNATIFPQQINAAASFNTKLVTRMGAITAKDTRSANIPWVFGPILGLLMQPSWPRVYETFGEDPHLISEMGSAIIKGLQGYPRKLNSCAKVAATMKHFIGYPFPQNGHDRTPSWIPDRMLYQYFVPPFQRAVDTGVATTMECYNEVNGVPVVSSHQYLRTLLRDQLQFKGVLVTDYSEINNLHYWHRIAPTVKKGVEISISRTSVDMSMIPTDFSFADDLIDLVRTGVIPETRVDESVIRLLSLKEELGLLDGSCERTSTTGLGSAEDWDISLAIARESIILAKNDESTLPIAEGKTILLTGPGADSIFMQCGGWSLHWQGSRNDADFPYGITIKTALSELLAEDGQSTLVYHPGCQFGETELDDCAVDALNLASTADIVVYVTGELPYAEKPGNIEDLTIDAGQIAFGQKLADTGKPLVLVLLEGRPRILNGLGDAASAVIAGFLPGPVGGQAIAETLVGQNNPSGKFPITYPRYVNAFPNPYWHKYSQDDSYNPQWPFGFGLSFTTFNYSDLKLSSTTLAPGQQLSAHVTVTNIGLVAGKESVLMYIADLYRIITPEVKILKGFRKIQLEPNQSVRVTFHLTVDDLTFYGVDNERALEDGTIEVHIGDQVASFEVVESDSWSTVQ
eukprot:TRINITY_DN1534_c0_g1_i1.p1 TRINITY_DN1534_c0_g1~~TRINITY_DN1534_c0_g1_i1.p1  ORF type:complete len:765 (-),score=180.80 TRINITY_DN1534_c0_g1_i1:524-2818(-)